MSSMRSTSACGEGIQMTSLPGWPDWGVKVPDPVLPNSGCAPALLKAARKMAQAVAEARTVLMSAPISVPQYEASALRGRSGPGLDHVLAICRRVATQAASGAGRSALSTD